MSRDLSPKELHLIDEKYGFSKEILKTTNLQTGQETIIYDPKCDLAIYYPNAYFLGQRVVETFKNIPTTLQFFEDTLSRIIRETDTETPITQLDDQMVRAIAAWYDGRLDPQFYYREHNDDLLIEQLKQFDIQY